MPLSQSTAGVPGFSIKPLIVALPLKVTDALLPTVGKYKPGLKYGLVVGVFSIVTVEDNPGVFAKYTVKSGNPFTPGGGSVMLAELAG